MTPAQQLKACQNGWSAFTTRQERAAYIAGLKRAVEICREKYVTRFATGISLAERCARAIEREIPPTPTEPVVREG